MERKHKLATIPEEPESTVNTSSSLAQVEQQSSPKSRSGSSQIRCPREAAKAPESQETDGGPRQIMSSSQVQLDQQPDPKSKSVSNQPKGLLKVSQDSVGQHTNKNSQQHKGSRQVSQSSSLGQSASLEVRYGPDGNSQGPVGSAKLVSFNQQASQETSQEVSQEVGDRLDGSSERPAGSTMLACLSQQGSQEASQKASLESSQEV